jgi:hypothetical protein
MLPLLGVVLIAGCSVNITLRRNPRGHGPRRAPRLRRLRRLPRRPAAAAHHLTLEPGDIATADVQAYAIDTATGNNCPRWGNLVVTAPNDYVSHPLSVDVPICSATNSPVD